MVEVQHRRLDVRREHTSLKFEGLRGVNASAASVDEAIEKLLEVELNLAAFHSSKPGAEGSAVAEKGGKAKGKGGKIESKQQRLKRMKDEVEGRKMWKEGKLVVRSEAEVKTHTSYLVFAVLPRDWSEEDEAKAKEKWPVDELMATTIED